MQSVATLILCCWFVNKKQFDVLQKHQKMCKSVRLKKPYGATGGHSASLPDWTKMI